MVATLGIFVVTASGDYSLVAIGGLLIVVAPLVAEHGLKGMRAAVVAPRRVESSRTRDQTHVPCIGTWFLIHCATRKVPVLGSFS